MNPIYKSALRAATLQRTLLKEYVNKNATESFIKQKFLEIFPMGDHIHYKLTKYYACDVVEWLKSLDEENTKIFLESDKFNFLN